MEEKKKNKILKSNKTLLIIGISLLAIAILLIIIPICLESINKLNPKTLHDLIYNNQDYEGKYAKINLAYEPYKFAVKDELFTCYLAIDKDGYMYIVRLTDKTYDELVKLQEEKQNDFSYELKGYIYEIPKELKKIAMESYNEMQEKQILTEENIDKYIGNVYLDETMSPKKEYINIIIASIFAFMAIVVFAIFVKNNKKQETKKKNEKITSKQEKK